MKHITFRRVSNLSATWLSWLVSTIVRHPVMFGMPPALGIELTNCCNLKCPECATGSSSLSRSAGFMDENLFRRIIDELSPWLFNANLYFQGEPMIHPNFFRFLELARGVHTTVSTNGHFLSGENASMLADSGLGTLIVSLDGADSATYSLYRKGGDFNKVMSGLREVSEAIMRKRSGMELVIQFLVNSHNEHQMRDIARIAKENSAKVHFKSMQIIDGNSHNYWLPSDPAFRRYHLKDSVYSTRSSLKNRCLRVWMNPVVSWDGFVYPCCFDKNGDHIMGNLNENSFREIWHGSRYTNFRKAVLTGRGKIPICRNCSQGLETGIN